MISNERVQALIALDRDTLIALMAAAADPRGVPYPSDPDVRALLDAARALNARAEAMSAPPQRDWMPRRMRVRS
jgi:hypothetical protein